MTITKRMKAILTLVCTFLATLVVSLCMVFNGNVKLAAAESADGITGVSIRIPGEGEVDGYGIRFQASVASKVENATYGMEIIPADLKESGTPVETVGALKAVEGGYEYYGAIVNLKQENLTRPYVARAFYDVEGAERQYIGDWSEAKAIFSVATQAIADEDTPVAPEHIETLKTSIVDVVMDETNAGYYAVKDVAISADGALADDSVITVSATAVNTANALRTLPVYPTSLVAADSDGSEIEGALTQVSGTENQYTVNFGGAASMNVQVKVGDTVVSTQTLTAATVLISNAEELVNFVTTATTENAVLTNDIDMAGVAFKTGSNVFSGTFDGKGHAITNLTLTGSTQGLFYQLCSSRNETATIRNLSLHGTLNATNSGFLAQRSNGNVVLQYLTVDVTMSNPESFQGTLIGMTYASAWATIRNCVVRTNDLNDAQGYLIGRLYGGGANIDNENYPCQFIVADENDLAIGNCATSTTRDEYNTTAAKTEYLATDLGSGYYGEGSDLTVDVSSVTGGVGTLYVNGVKTTNTVAANKLTVKAADMPKVAGEISIVILSADGESVYTASKTFVVKESYITTPAQLVNFLSTATTETAVLGNDIDMSETVFPKSDSTVTFSGTFDGNGHAIKNLTINSDQTGLFYSLGGATIKNVAIIDAVMGSSTSQNGVIAFRADSGTNLIENVMVSVTLKDSCSYQGALIGFGWNATINFTNCVVYVKNEADGTHGALIARHNAGAVTLTDCHFIAKCNLVSNMDLTSSNGKRDETNALATPYATAGNFNEAIAKGTVALTAWQTAQWGIMCPTQSACL